MSSHESSATPQGSTALEIERSFWREFAAHPAESVLEHIDAAVPLSQRRLAYVTAVQDAVLQNPAYRPYTTKTGRGRSFCNIAFSDQARQMGVRGASVLGIRSANAQVRRLRDRAERGRGWMKLSEKTFIQELANLGIFVGAGRIETTPDEFGELHGHVAVVRSGPDDWVSDPDAPFLNNIGTNNRIVPHTRSHSDFEWFSPTYDPTARVIAFEAAVQLGSRFCGETSRASCWFASLLKTAEDETRPGTRGPVSDRARVAQHYCAGFLRDLANSAAKIESSWIIDACHEIAARR